MWKIQLVLFADSHAELFMLMNPFSFWLRDSHKEDTLILQFAVLFIITTDGFQAGMGTIVVRNCLLKASRDFEESSWL